jgi:hypothetical protein
MRRRFCNIFGSAGQKGITNILKGNLRRSISEDIFISLVSLIFSDWNDLIVVTSKGDKDDIEVDACTAALEVHYVDVSTSFRLLQQWNKCRA